MTDKVDLSHIANDGSARMVDVSRKEATPRSARAAALVRVGPDVAQLLLARGGVHKGNVLETARIAGFMAAKRTAELIPMCHPLPLDSIEIETEVRDGAVHITASVACTGKTGVEMEAMVAAATCALTVYDMCKSASKGIEIQSVHLLEKRGGKSGLWRRQEDASWDDSSASVFRSEKG